MRSEQKSSCSKTKSKFTHTMILHQKIFDEERTYNAQGSSLEPVCGALYLLAAAARLINSSLSGAGKSIPVRRHVVPLRRMVTRN